MTLSSQLWFLPLWAQNPPCPFGSPSDSCSVLLPAVTDPELGSHARCLHLSCPRGRPVPRGWALGLPEWGRALQKVESTFLPVLWLCASRVLRTQPASAGREATQTNRGPIQTPRGGSSCNMCSSPGDAHPSRETRVPTSAWRPRTPLLPKYEGRRWACGPQWGALGHLAFLSR